MPTFIKAGFWETLCQKCTGYRGWLNLDKFVQDKLPQPSYKVYTVLLTQTGSNDPISYELENTLGVTITWSRDDVGRYYGTASSSIFSNNNTNHKQVAIIGADRGNINTKTFLVDYSTNTINLDSLDNTGTYTDGLMLLLPLEVRVYP